MKTLTVAVLSGPIASGKSHLLNAIASNDNIKSKIFLEETNYYKDSALSDINTTDFHFEVQKNLTKQFIFSYKHAIETAINVKDDTVLILDTFPPFVGKVFSDYKLREKLITKEQHEQLYELYDSLRIFLNHVNQSLNEKRINVNLVSIFRNITIDFSSRLLLERSISEHEFYMAHPEYYNNLFNNLGESRELNLFNEFLLPAFSGNIISGTSRHIFSIFDYKSLEDTNRKCLEILKVV